VPTYARIARIAPITPITMITMITTITPITISVLLCAAASGCPPSIPPDDPRLATDSQLPDDVPGLLRYAEARMEKAREGAGFVHREAAGALKALQKARRIEPGNRAVLETGARVARALGEHARSPGEQLKYARAGLPFTRTGRKAFPDRVAFHYYHAALLGLKVDAYRASAMKTIPELRRAARRAVALDKSYDHAGPLRILGSLLASIPAVAPFNGDVVKGIALLEQAVKLAPAHPLNHFLLAQAYAKDDEQDAAARHYARVLCAPAGPPHWDTPLARRYRKKARAALRKMSRSPNPPCPGG
jgi:tetratricopeptide (TPR) repeat protein